MAIYRNFYFGSLQRGWKLFVSKGMRDLVQGISLQLTNYKISLFTIAIIWRKKKQLITKKWQTGGTKQVLYS